MASRSRSPSRGRQRSLTRSASPRSDDSRSPRRRRYDSRSPSRSVTPPPRRNGRYRSDSQGWGRGRGRDARDASESPLARSTKIVVERLSKNINEDHLHEIFGQFGPIKDLDLPMNRTFGTNRGTAYILFDHEADAEAAISHMHEAQVDGATINVSIVLPRRKLSPPPPTARRGANIDPRIPMSGPRGGAGPPGRGGGFNAGGGHPRHARRPDLQEHLRPAVVAAAAADTAADPTLRTRLVLGQGHPDRDDEVVVVVVGAAQAQAEAEAEGGEDSKTTMTDDAAAAAVMTATRVEAREATGDDWGRVCFWAWMQNFVKLVAGVQVLLAGVDSPSWGGVLIDQPVDVRVYWRWEWLTQGSRSRCHVAALFYGASEVYGGHAACLGGTIRQV
ncbi:hypothetical protein MHUMG1_07719 [Metarhizium humberi]|uniref:RRM domain-containing protein n=1 Tax=Metarhizium humberi TaxID=2596975 RepID=A0A9P8M7T1_9HYPO|nr:hypothetical protein MHUMG1_07719 [Metarhizium humberi]